MGKSRNELRKVSKAKTREALANTDPDNVELQQRAERYHAAQKAEREAREAEYPGLTKLEIDRQKALQKALQKVAEARTAVDAVQSQLRNREQRLKQAKDAGERRAVTDSITLIKSKLGAALVDLNAAEAKVTEKTKEVEADKAKAEGTLVPDSGGQSSSLGSMPKPKNQLRLTWAMPLTILGGSLLLILGWTSKRPSNNHLPSEHTLHRLLRHHHHRFARLLLGLTLPRLLPQQYTLRHLLSSRNTLCGLHSRRTLPKPPHYPASPPPFSRRLSSTHQRKPSSQAAEKLLNCLSKI
ncbi:hypothetical protein G7Y79_00003g012270 [Physcia stellaris]|nr:hypothetical protein G7Y79_00003g012270 [Physcia stellaris]